MGENYLVFTTVSDKDTKTEKNSQNEDKITDKNISISNISTSKSESLNVKIFSGNIRHDILTFTHTKSPFTIGRSNECDIPIDDVMLSRVHCTVRYKEGKWYIIDGQIISNSNGCEDVYVKNSTNGTWIYAFEDTLIYEQTTFKANHNLFICSFNY